ncbi:hypothetical protein [Candidatus Nitrosotenuis sp. DW1]|uniref:hypothetical protein n=1 Tax=Candidatus Nitrosotenuis sp. DW1 TaxID=2259672 RepID=UPI0015C74043|nr:hypothetical protein [Candidatus Nitrosotenuis sp. DW1]QLH08505.1 hypothetical protein DSQ19_02525 [Candidatus Nitrosotenuis sp. DW1]
MTSLAKLAQKLKQEKLDAAKQRRLQEKMLKEAVSLARRSSSGLSSVEHRMEDSKVKLGEINAEFNHVVARKESLERLASAAQERLTQEIAAKDQAETDLQNAETEGAKQIAAERLEQIIQKIAELEEEAKQRQAAADTLVKVIEDFKKSKTKTSHQIQKQAKSKPVLLSQIKTSIVDSERLKKRVDMAVKKEQNVSKILDVVSKKLAEQLARKRKAAAKKAAAKRKSAAKKAAAKRKAAARKATKKKTTKKKTAKKKTASKKKTAAKKKSVKKQKKNSRR